MIRELKCVRKDSTQCCERLTALLITLFAAFLPISGMANDLWVIRYEMVGLTPYSRSFVVNIYEDGNVNYEGTKAVKLLGKTQKRLAASQVKHMLAEINQLGFFKLKEQYMWADAHPPQKGPQPKHGQVVINAKDSFMIGYDDQIWVLEVRTGNTIKRVMHDRLSGLNGEAAAFRNETRILRRIVYDIERATIFPEWVTRPTVNCLAVNECKNP